MGKDLGTAMIVLFIGFVAFLLGGYPGKVLAAFAALGIIGIVGLIAYSPNRLNRVLAAYQSAAAPMPKRSATSRYTRNTPWPKAVCSG